MKELQALFEDEAGQNLYLLSLRGERAGVYDFFEKQSRGELKNSDPRADAKDSPLIVRSWARLYLRYNQGAALERTNRSVSEARKPRFEQHGMGGSYDTTHDDPSWLDAYLEFVARLMTRTTVPTGDSFVRYTATCRAIALLIAAERYRLANGALPAKLADIETSLLPGSSVDPCDGKPMRILRKDEVLTAYSVGIDKRDDHGAIEYDRVKNFWFNRGRDIGFGLWPVKSRRIAASSG